MRNRHILYLKNIHKDTYFQLLNMSWLRLVIIFFTLYVILNIFFGTLYFCIPSSINNTNPEFQTAFFFSVQTMSTIGYGTLSPSGLSANLLVVVQSFIGLMSVAVMTGVFFARLSRPSARIRFSKNILMTKQNGVDVVCVRIGNTRGNDILQAKVHLTALIHEKTLEGESIRKIHNLKLIRDYSPFFRLTWFISHPIDESSPLFHYQQVDQNLIGFMLTVSGHDGIYSTTVYDQHFYQKSDLVKDRFFKDIMHEVSENVFEIDYDNFDSLKD